MAHARASTRPDPAGSPARARSAPPGPTQERARSRRGMRARTAWRSDSSDPGHRETMFSTDLLPIYLNDHLAASTLGRDLARRAAGSNQGTEFGDFLTDL